MSWWWEPTRAHAQIHTLSTQASYVQILFTYILKSEVVDLNIILFKFMI